jgi:NADH-quinone oxidoreductase subunit N
MVMQGFYLIVPELILAIVSCVGIALGAFSKRHSDRFFAVFVCLFCVLSASCYIFAGQEQYLWDGALVIDNLSVFAKSLILLTSSIVLLVTWNFWQREKMLSVEYPVLVGISVLGMMFMVSAGNFLVLYLAMEIQAIPLYVLAAYGFRGKASSEAAMKYFIFGALASGIFLYGVSLVYGMTGSLKFLDVSLAIGAMPEGGTPLLLVGVVCIIVGICLKLALAPFHMWAPDVYQGSSLPFVMFIATVPKIAGMIVFLRLMYDAFLFVSGQWIQVIAIIAAVSIVAGALAAVVQSNIRRLIAYSSVAHMGYAMLGFLAGTEEGVAAVIVYLIIYTISAVGLFSLLLSVNKSGQFFEKVSDFSGLSKRSPALALGFAILLLSLAGIPPFFGFFAKLFVFRVALQQGMLVLVLLAAVMAVIGAYYYLKIIKVMYFSEPTMLTGTEFSLTHRTVAMIACILLASAWLPFVNGFFISDVAEWASFSLF